MTDIDGNNSDKINSRDTLVARNGFAYSFNFIKWLQISKALYNLKNLIITNFSIKEENLYWWTFSK